MNKEQIFTNSFMLDSNNLTNLNNVTSGNSTSEDYWETNFIIQYFHYIWIIFLLIHIVYFIFMIIKLNFFKKDLLQEVGENAQERRKINEECPICMENIKDEIQLLCYHSFCAHCIINYGRHTFNMIDILCPMCRQKSKILFANFDRNEQNKENYDIILNYNHEFTQYNYSSLCFCIDFVKFFFFYLKQIANFNNPRYRAQRSCISLFIVFVIVYFIIIFTHKFKDSIEIVEDIFYYCCLVFVIAEYFYRNFRNRTNNEFHQYYENSNENANLEDNIISNVNEEYRDDIQV